MEFADEAVVLAARAHGEAHAVAELFTAAHGRWAGLVYGGQSRRARPLLQIGNGVHATWKGRPDALGHFSVELTRARAAGLLQDRLSLAGLSAACALAAACLPEREAQPGVYAAMSVLLDALDDHELWPALMARWELGLLSALGFGLSLKACVATGAREDLVYVSPKSAHAVSRAAGAPYADRLLPLPAFLKEPGAAASLEDACAGLTTTGYFLETRLLHPGGRRLPEARRAVLPLLQARAENS